MFTPFDQMPAQSRLWIYQSDRKLNQGDAEIISESLQAFTNVWKVHGQPMKASFTVLHDYFIVLAADENFNAASGCSIDDSVRTIKTLGDKLAINWFNRNNVAFKTDAGISLVSLGELKTKLTGGFWNKVTPVFNNMITEKSELASHWIVPSGSTWLKRYLPTETVSS